MFRPTCFLAYCKIPIYFFLYFFLCPAEDEFITRKALGLTVFFRGGGGVMDFFG